MSDNEIKMAQMQKDIDYVKQDISEVKKLLADFIDRADRKYAPMYAWRFMIWSGAIIGSYIIYLALKALER